jgi:hypothetical protein
VSERTYTAEIYFLTRTVSTEWKFVYLSHIWTMLERLSSLKCVVVQLQILWNNWWSTRRAAECLVWGGQLQNKHTDHSNPSQFHTRCQDKINEMCDQELNQLNVLHGPISIVTHSLVSNLTQYTLFWWVYSSVATADIQKYFYCYVSITSGFSIWQIFWSGCIA